MKTFLLSWLHHAALNTGVLLHDLSHLTRHPKTKNRLKAILFNIRTAGEAALFILLPPTLHHTKDQIADLSQRTTKEWFLHGLRD